MRHLDIMMKDLEKEKSASCGESKKKYQKTADRSTSTCCTCLQTGHWVFDKFNNGTYKCPALKPQSQQQQSAQPKKELDEGTGIEQREDSVNLIQQEINGLTEAGFLTGTFPPNIHDLNAIKLFNPLSVIKQVQANGTVKYRPVLDCSCKVNSLLKYGTVNLDDLSSFEKLIEENDYFTCFDMSSMYHHIFF